MKQGFLLLHDAEKDGKSIIVSTDCISSVTSTDENTSEIFSMDSGSGEEMCIAEVTESVDEIYDML